MPRIIGDTIFPKKIPNLNHNLFKGVKIIELINPNIKKIKDKINDHNLMSPSLIIGYNAIIKKYGKDAEVEGTVSDKNENGLLIRLSGTEVDAYLHQNQLSWTGNSKEYLDKFKNYCQILKIP